jgi:hypothetical protein
MTVVEQPTENHGVMPWTRDFDPEGRAIFRCPQCGRTIALGGPAKPNYRRIEQGNFYAGHSAYTTIEIVKAALELELWPQAPNNSKFLKAWEEDGGGPLLTIGGISVEPPEGD